MHDRLVIPATRVPDLPAACELPELLYRFLSSRYGIRIAALREAIRTSAGDARHRTLLDLEGETAVLVIDEIAYDQAGVPTIWGVHRAVTDRFCYLNEIRCAARRGAGLRAG